MNGVSALIALLITITICYLAIRVKAEVPSILGNALSIILGFFFGSQASKKKS